MNKKILSAALAVVMLLIVALPASAAIQATSVEVRGEVYDTYPEHVPNATGIGIASWNAHNFAGFWYDLKNGLKSENMSITKLDSNKRNIEDEGLIYDTTKQPVEFKVSEDKKGGVEQSYEYNATTGKGKKVGTGGTHYYKIGWQAEQYVALNGKANKLARLIIEQGKASSEKKTLTVGESWDVGGGWTLSAQAIDAKASPRQVWLILSKDNVKKDDKVAYMGQVYTYVEKSIGGESDVPLFVTYIDSVFAGQTSDMVQLRYTWAVDTGVTEVKGGDKFGVMKVKTAEENKLILWNEDTSISLSKDSTADVMGNLKFKVADNDNPRFYPLVIRTAPGTHEVRGEVYDTNPVNVPNATGCVPTCVAGWNAQNFAGFWYDLKNGLKSENMAITKLDSNKRNIEDEGLIYDTTKQPVEFKVSEDKKGGVEQSYEYNATTGTGKKVGTGGTHYYKIGWQAEQYVALNGKANKLARLIIEQGKASSEKRTLTVGESWDVGGGWTLSAQAIDAKASPRQVWLILSKDNVKKDDKVAYMGQVYTYVEKSIGGESDVPLFVTYIDSVFAGQTSDMVQLRYTWAVDTGVTEVKGGDKFGVMKVKTAEENKLVLWNEDTSISLSKDSTADVMGNLKFKVADNDNPRFYPKVDYQILGGNETPTGTAVTGTATVTGTGTAKATPKGNETVTATATATAPAVTETGAKTPAATATAKEPGFEAVFAIAGLLAVAYLVLRQRK